MKRIHYTIYGGTRSLIGELKVFGFGDGYVMGEGASQKGLINKIAMRLDDRTPFVAIGWWPEGDSDNRFFYKLEVYHRKWMTYEGMLKIAIWKH